MYRVKTASHRVDKEITDLPQSARGRVLRAIQQSSANPRPLGSRKLSGEMRGAWRIRVGDYRVIDDVDDDQQTVIILAVLHRREAYR